MIAGAMAKTGEAQAQKGEHAAAADTFARLAREFPGHPRAAERDFVLVPWLAVDPDAILPGRGRVDGLLAALRGSPA